MTESEVRKKVPAFKNPFRPGAGHMPPHLAGRQYETTEFRRLLDQETILENLILTGLRGVGKTVLLERLKPSAMASGWLWAGTDLSESMSISEDNLSVRLLTDLSVVTSPIEISHPKPPAFFKQDQVIKRSLNYQGLKQIYDGAPGLAADKLKSVLEVVWFYLQRIGKRGIIFAYDEAQNLSDHAAKEQFPLSLLLDVFQSLQRKNIPFMLALTGLPTLFPKLVEARTYTERMFRVVSMGPLDKSETKEAIVRPIDDAPECPIEFKDETIDLIWQTTKGYPYFVQYFCREIFDVWVQSASSGEELAPIPLDSITRKLDSDFFSGRWAKTTDRQRELLTVVSSLDNADREFTVHDIVEQSAALLEKPFSASHANQMLVALAQVGLVFKNRHGKYSFAVPLMGAFIRRQIDLSMSNLFDDSDSSIS